VNTSKRSDIYARQWDVGSFTDPTKKPYKVSERRDGRWECSCPAWTRHTPRTDCKHIIKVQAALRRAAVTAADTIDRPEPPAAMVFENYTIRRRARLDLVEHEDTLTDTAETFGADTGTATARRSRREI
jgi:hypothetical protein